MQKEVIWIRAIAENEIFLRELISKILIFENDN